MAKTLAHIVILAGMLACLAAHSSGDLSTPRSADWPQFRGPDGQGHAPQNLPTAWSDTEHVVWSTPLPGKGWSSPVIGGGLIWVTTAVGDKDGPHSLRALAVEEMSGRIRHNVELFTVARPDPLHARNSLASPTPVLDGERLYAHFGKYGTAAVETRTGRVLWKNTQLVIDHETGPACSPVLYKDLLLCSMDGTDQQYAAALNTATGDLVWKTARLAAVGKEPSMRRAFATPLLISVGGQHQVVMPGSHCVYSYEPRSGTELWRVRYTGFSNVPRPVFAHGLVYVCTGFAPPQLWAIRPDGQGDVTDSHVVWRHRKNVPNIPSPVIVDDLLFTVSDAGIATCLEAKTGKVVWSERLPGTFSASLLAAGDTLYAFGQYGKTTLFKAARTYQQIAQNELTGRVEATPAVSGGYMFIRTEQRLVKIGR